jgi:hypothetical protein
VDHGARHLAGLAVAQYRRPVVPDEGPLAFWLGALGIKLFGWLLGDVLAARVGTMAVFLLGVLSLWYATFNLGRRRMRSRCGWPSAASPNRTTSAARWPTPPS